MNHTPARIFMFFLVLGLAFTHLSCSSNLSELTGSVSLEIPQSIVSRANVEDENEGSSELYVVAMAQGDGYASAQYKTIRAGSLSSEDRFMKLLDIPAEKNIRIVMSVIDSQGERKYYGSTETFYVQHGINVQNIRIARVNEAAGYSYTSRHCDFRFNGIHSIINSPNSDGTLRLYDNGWYEIVSTGTDPETIISAGIWEDSTNNTKNLTEYVYKEYNPQFITVDLGADYTFVEPYPGIIIADSPMKYNIPFDSYDDVYNYSFTLRNEVVVNVALSN